MSKQKTLFQGRKINIVEIEQYINDRVITSQVVEHPGASVILPFIDDDTVVMVRNYRPAFNKEILELPAGTIKRGENPLACAKRELVEETGYRAYDFELLGEYFMAPGFCNGKNYVYVARGLKCESQSLEADEIISVEIYLFDEVVKMIGAGEIKDSKTIVAVSAFNRR